MAVWVYSQGPKKWPEHMLKDTFLLYIFTCNCVGRWVRKATKFPSKKTRLDFLQGQGLFRREKNNCWPELSGNVSQFLENLAFHLLNKMMDKKTNRKKDRPPKKNRQTKRHWDKETNRQKTENKNYYVVRNAGCAHSRYTSKLSLIF